VTEFPREEVGVGGWRGRRRRVVVWFGDGGDGEDKGGGFFEAGRSREDEKSAAEFWRGGTVPK
jgi:hypothetical protein